MLNFLRFPFNKSNVENKPLEEIKMNVKVSKNIDTNHSKNSYPSTGETISSKKPPIFISIYNDKIIKNKYLTYIGQSKRTGYPIYSLEDGTDISFIKNKGFRVEEILNLNSSMLNRQQSNTIKLSPTDNFFRQ